MLDFDGIVPQLLIFETVLQFGLRKTLARMAFVLLFISCSLHVLFGVPLLDGLRFTLHALSRIRMYFADAESGLQINSGSSFVKHCSSSVAVGFLAGLAAFGIEVLRRFRTFQRTFTTDRVLEFKPHRL